MFEPDKRVRISFTVEMTEVPGRIAGLLREAEARCADITNRLKETATNLDVQGNIQSAYNSVDAMRQEMLALDVRLEDCQVLLNGYQATISELNSSDLKTGNEEQEGQLETVIEDE